MHVNSTDQHINFGWSKTTHLEITMLALRDYSIDNIKKRQLARYSQMPDFDRTEIGYLNNMHFYFPNSLKKSFGRNSDKFNAYDQFKEHLTAALQCCDNDGFLKHAGYALHYLQDVSVPLHTEKGGILHKVMKYNLHKEFERNSKYGVQSNLKKLKNNYQYSRLSFTTLLDLFKNTAEFSQNPEFKITGMNKKKWYSIQQRCFDIGVNTTREFFGKLLSVKSYINC